MSEIPTFSERETSEHPHLSPQELASQLGSRAGLLSVELAEPTRPKYAVMGVRERPDGSLDWSAATSFRIPESETGGSSQQTEEQEAGKESLTLTGRLELAIEELKHEPQPKVPYSLEDAEHDRPFTHYTQPGNIFQILRFGIQSGSFKNRVNARRDRDVALDDIAAQMSGLRYQKGGSYQGKDSISLGMYDSRTLRSEGFVLLVDPDIKVYGMDPAERDSTTGYGHGIVDKDKERDFDIGNPTAYQTEVLAANIIPPSEIKGVVLNNRASIISSLRSLTHNSVALYSQAKHENPAAAKEDLLATSRLIASLTDNPDAEARVDEVAQQVEALPTLELIKTLNLMNRELLHELAGHDIPLTEESLRSALEDKFKIKFIVPDGEVAV